jgi:hypothetical protein
MMTMMYYGFLRFSEAANLEYGGVRGENDGILLNIKKNGQREDCLFSLSVTK